jgi:ParB family chromosome partitioning protein
VQGILTLLQQGEQRLLVAVEKGAIPLNAALAIVGAGKDDKAVQAALQEAYESGTLRGKSPHRCPAGHGAPRQSWAARSTGEHAAQTRRRDDVESRANLPEGSRTAKARWSGRPVHPAAFAVRRQRATSSFFQDENFTNLLRAEGLDTLPKYLAMSGSGLARAAA